MEWKLWVSRAAAVYAASGLAVGASSAAAAPGDVQATPDARKLPGGEVLKNLTDGIAAWALIASLVGLFIGAIVWALGSHTQNWQHTHHGKRAVMVSSLAALVTGAAPAIINFFASQGRAFK